MVLVSVTRLHLKSPMYVPAWLWHTAQSTWQIINTPGFVGGELVVDKYGGAWTLTMWKNEVAMHNYRNSGAHRQVMPFIQKWCDEAAVVHWEQADGNLPDMAQAMSYMVENGRFTRLSQPSSRHREQKIPAPSSVATPGLPLSPRKKAPTTAVEH